MGRLITKISFYDQAQWIELARLSDFRAANLARRRGISQRQVERYVKRHFARSPQQWLRDLRMAKAGELVQVMHSVKEVAYALGFRQVSSFCREFKIYYGVTCSEYAASLATRNRTQSVAQGSVVTNVDWCGGDDTASPVGRLKVADCFAS